MTSLNMFDSDKIHPQSHNSTQYIYSSKKNWNRNSVLELFEKKIQNYNVKNQNTSKLTAVTVGFLCRAYAIILMPPVLFIPPCPQIARAKQSITEIR